jgi:putative redox protein
MKSLQRVFWTGGDGGPMAARRSVVEMVTPTKFLATGYTGAKVLFHNPGEGEVREGPSPFESVVLAAGGCTAIDVVDILRKEREPVESFRIELESERAKGPPAVLEALRLTYVLKGPRKKANVERAIELSQEKYCSVSIMLKRAGIAMTTAYRIES